MRPEPELDRGLRFGRLHHRFQLSAHGSSFDSGSGSTDGKRNQGLADVCCRPIPRGRARSRRELLLLLGSALLRGLLLSTLLLRHRSITSLDFGTWIESRLPRWDVIVMAARQRRPGPNAVPRGIAWPRHCSKQPPCQTLERGPSVHFNRLSERRLEFEPHGEGAMCGCRYRSGQPA